MFKICLTFVLFSFVHGSALNNGTFYFVGLDCNFKSAVDYSAHVTTIENYRYTETEKSCENIASAVHQNSKGNHLVVIKYESGKEISIMIKQINDLADFNLKDSFTKVNYEYMLGDYCSFDKSLLSLGIDSNMVYTTVKCGEETWAFMRSILTLDGNFYTPARSLIYFKKGDPSFDRLLFVSTYDGSVHRDVLIQRYKGNADGKIKYVSTYLHQLNNTKPSTEISVPGITNMFSSSMGAFAYFEKLHGPEKTEIKIYETENPMETLVDDSLSPVVQKKIQSKDPLFIRAWGLYPKLFEERRETITWKIDDTKRTENFVSEECIMGDTEESIKDDCIDEESSSPWFFYLIAGIELIIFLVTLATLVTLIVLKRKKQMAKVISKKEGPAVTQVATVVPTQMDDATNTNNV